MGILVAILGPSGAGKTTLIQTLNVQARFAVGLESHSERPFRPSSKRTRVTRSSTNWITCFTAPNRKPPCAPTRNRS